ncbi:MAG: AEC family transporter, partial [Firmicutes bacterium]|nr:AEC family transporter [Bacillota bacterium]
MAIVIEKVISIFVIILIGYVACRLGWLPQTASKYISKLLMNIAMPCLIVASMVQQSLTPEVGRNLVITSILCLILFTVTTLVGFVVARIMKVPLKDQGIYAFCLGYSNNGFLGFPVAQSIFGVEGLLFMILSNLMMNIHNFSFGIMTLTYGDRAKAPLKEKLKRFFNIPVVASLLGLVFLIVDVDLPEAPMSILTMLGNMTVPLSMIFLGIQLAQSSFKDVAGVKINHVISIFRLVIFPA